MADRLFASLGRIADFDEKPFDVEPLAMTHWETGDYALTSVTGTPTALYHIEDRCGAMIATKPGDRVVGALGERAATLEGVGTWKSVVDGEMQTLTSAGILGVFTSFSRFLPEPMSVDYCGHLFRNGRKLRMRDFALQAAECHFAVPTILLVGTSMSAGKTTTGRLVCRVLASAGFKVIGAKLTGAGRYRDILSFQDSGAVEIYDFVDVGLPSTVVDEHEFRQAIRPLLARIDDHNADFLIAEAGASPLEPYNGAAAMDELGDNIVCTILCASDPYAVVGVQQAFGLQPDLVTGPATTTSAAIDLVHKLTGLPSINVIDRNADSEMRSFLQKKLRVEIGPD